MKECELMIAHCLSSENQIFNPVFTKMVLRLSPRLQYIYRVVHHACNMYVQCSKRTITHEILTRRARRFHISMRQPEINRCCATSLEGETYLKIERETEALALRFLPYFLLVQRRAHLFSLLILKSCDFKTPLI